MSLPVWILFALSTVLAAESDAPTTAPTVTASGMVLDGEGSVVWRPGLASIRHGNGQLAWSENTRTCFDEDGERVRSMPCTVVLDDHNTLLVDHSEGALTPSVVLVIERHFPPEAPSPDRLPTIAAAR